MTAPSNFRLGIVSEREAATARVRVVFGDQDALVSYWLPVMQGKTLEDQAYWMPDVGEHVVCLLDAHAEFGVVLGAIYSGATPPPIADMDKLHVVFKDGTVFQYDRVAHTLHIDLPAGAADIEVSTTRNVTVTSSAGDITLNVPNDKNVFLGGQAGALRLATEKFVEVIYENHLHPTPAGISGKPIPFGTELVWPQVTKESKSQ